MLAERNCFGFDFRMDSSALYVVAQNTILFVDGILFSAAINADRLPTVEVRKTSVLASDNLSSVYVCHNINPP